MVLHHVVPISKGGLDDPSNIVVLCPECHDKVHDLSLGGLRKPFANFAGRPRTCASEDEEKYYSQYINCEIGTKELKEKLGVKSGSKIKDRPGFIEFLERHHIKAYKNSIDLRTARKPKLIDGEWIGRVVFEDGAEKEFYYSEPKQLEEPVEEIVPEVVPEQIVEPEPEVAEVETAEGQGFDEAELEYINSHFRGMDVVEFEKWMFTHPNERENLRSHGA